MDFTVSDLQVNDCEHQTPHITDCSTALLPQSTAPDDVDALRADLAEVYEERSAARARLRIAEKLRGACNDRGVALLRQAQQAFAVADTYASEIDALDDAIADLTTILELNSGSLKRLRHWRESPPPCKAARAHSYAALAAE